LIVVGRPNNSRDAPRHRWWSDPACPWWSVCGTDACVTDASRNAAAKVRRRRSVVRYQYARGREWGEVFLAVTSTAPVSIRSCPRPPASEHPAQSRCYTYVTSLMTWLAYSVAVAMTPVLSYIQYTRVYCQRLSRETSEAGPTWPLVIKKRPVIQYTTSYFMQCGPYVQEQLARGHWRSAASTWSVAQ